MQLSFGLMSKGLRVQAFGKFRWRSSHLRTRKQLARCRCLLLDHFAAQNLHLPSWTAGKTCLTWQTWLELTFHYKCTIWSLCHYDKRWIERTAFKRFDWTLMSKENRWCGLAWGKGMLCLYSLRKMALLDAWGLGEGLLPRHPTAAREDPLRCMPNNWQLIWAYKLVDCW